MMKTNTYFILRLVGIMLILLSQSACRTHKSVNRQHTRSSSLEITVDSIREVQSRSFSLVRAVRDSSDQVYRVTIFPADTFQFSMEKGFIGKASKVELTGSMRQLKEVHDSAVVAAVWDRGERYEVIKEVDEEERLRFKNVERKGVGWWLVAGFVGVVVVWVGWRWKG